jgi:copper chaperone
VAEQVTLKVTGMTCGGCENAVKRAVGSLKGVSDVRASHQANEVTVTYDPALIDRAAIAQRIETAGYRVAA